MPAELLACDKILHVSAFAKFLREYASNQSAAEGEHPPALTMRNVIADDTDCVFQSQSLLELFLASTVIHYTFSVLR
jgi:hypothetical protein